MAAFRQWWEHARTEYLDLGEDRLPQIVTMYYDPLLDVHHKVPISFVLGKVTYLLPLVPHDARRFFDGALEALGGLKDEIPADVIRNPRNAGALIHATRELGLSDLADRLQAACDEALEPNWNRERGEFTWGCGLNEEHPRGQFNALLALGEATSEGAWAKLCSEQMPKNEAVVRGIDFPTVALSEARWVNGELHLRLDPQNQSVTGQETSFRIVGLEDAAAWTVAGPGTAAVIGADVVVTTRVDDVQLILRRA